MWAALFTGMDIPAPSIYTCLLAIASESEGGSMSTRLGTGVIASLLLLAFAVYIGSFLGEWDLALLVVTTVLGANILVYGFLN
jgi:hypothetical protein